MMTIRSRQTGTASLLGILAATRLVSAQEVDVSAAASSEEGTVGADAPRNAGDPSSTEERQRDVRAQNGITGPTGLGRVASADSGSTGTIRLSLLNTFFGGQEFLCPDCSQLGASAPVTSKDDVSYFGSRFQLSITPASFLEAFGSVRFNNVSNDQGSPSTIQTVGDYDLGLKAFMPREVDQLFRAGGLVQASLLSGPGQTGTEAVNVNLRALATLDLSNRANVADNVPLRLHANVGYLFDNSGDLATSIESQRETALTAEQRITRVERFGHDINRVDSFELGLGLEGVFEYARPYAEWTIDVPVNRQDHVCNLLAISAGDGCLSSNSGFATTPSRVTLGSRFYPWIEQWLEGVALTAAVDIGTGATSDFIEEVAPELPWAIHIGLGYAVDTAPRVQVRRVEVTRTVEVQPPPEHRIEGVVVDKKTGEPIADAIVHYAGQGLTGMASNPAGQFISGPVAVGQYTLELTAAGYKSGQCVVVVAAEPAAAAPAAASSEAPVAAGKSAEPVKGDPPPPAAAPAEAATPAAEDTAAPVSATTETSADGQIIARVTCELEALPKVGTLEGVVRDGQTTQRAAGVAVKVTDALGRSLNITTDASGAFRFENVPVGDVTLTVSGEEYLTTSSSVTIKNASEVSAQLTVNPRPKQSNVVVTAREVKLKKKVHFQHDSSEILPDSSSILEEIADVLISKAEITSIEIQGHTDNSGTEVHNLQLSTQRAQAVKRRLVELGVDESRLTSKGYGAEKPIGTNASEAGRARNRRVQLMIQR